MGIIRLIIIIFFAGLGGLGLKEHFIDGKPGALGGAVFFLLIALLLLFLARKAAKRRNKGIGGSVHGAALAQHEINQGIADYEREISSE